MNVRRISGSDRQRGVVAVQLVCSVLITLFSTLGLGWAQTDAAQAQPEKAQKIAAIKESLAKNKTALKQYTWTETTQISMKGEVKKQTQKQCQYGPDGKVQKTPIGGEEAQQSQPPQQESGGRRRGGGLVKKEVAKKKVDELKDYVEQVGELVKEYVPPDPQKIQAAQTAGNVSVQAPAGGSGPGISIKNYAKEGDSVDLGLNSTTKKISSYNVHSYLDNPKDNPVSLAVTFSSLPDGTNYAQQTLLDMPSKKMQVKITNSDYKKISP
jgi:hypothetical protein